MQQQPRYKLNSWILLEMVSEQVESLNVTHILSRQRMLACPGVSPQGPSCETCHSYKTQHHPGDQDAKVGPEMVFGSK